MSTEIKSEKAVNFSQDPQKTNDQNPQNKYDTPAYKVRKRRLGDRRDGRKLRTLDGLHMATPFVMADRNDACNTFADEVNINAADDFVREQLMSGKENFSMLHVILAAYVRTISQYPFLNRFVSGQRIFARNTIDITMVVKKEMSMDAPETSIRVIFDPRDTVYDVYEKFNEQVMRAVSTENETDGIAGFFRKFPRFLFRWAVSLIKWLDYHGICPKLITEGLPFWGSMIITSMGSLGIKPIYHHLYNLGNLPVFISYGTKRRIPTVDVNGNRSVKKVIDLKVVTDERICDGFQYATAFKAFRKYIENPQSLTIPPEKVVEDIE